jgi:hypothetical protein
MKMGDTVKWENVPNNSLVFDDFIFVMEKHTTNWDGYVVFHKGNDLGEWIGNSERWSEDKPIGCWEWTNKYHIHSPTVIIIALNLSGNESISELRKLFIRGHKFSIIRKHYLL